MLTIGEFSRICFVTKKTLRHYDEIGLLRPEHTAENGYRYYTVEQLRTMLLISRLKNYGFSLPEIAAVLARQENSFLMDKLMEKHAQLMDMIQEESRLLVQLEQDVAKLKRSEDIMEYHIIVKTIELEPQLVYYIRRRINFKDFMDMFTQLFSDIEKKSLQPLGPPMAFYHEYEFNPENTDVEVAVPVSKAVEGTRDVSGGLHCMTTIVGPYGDETFKPAYAGIVKWIEDNGYQITGAPFDRYVKGGCDCPPEEYVTEVYCPIAKK